VALHVNSVTFDADDPPALARFWASVFETEAPDPPSPYVAFVAPEGGPQLMFIKVPEATVAKNRCHLDLHADDIAAVDAEVDRLVGLGASLVDRHEEFGVYPGARAARRRRRRRQERERTASLSPRRSRGDRRGAARPGWRTPSATFQDPEGNELCVGTPLAGHGAPETM